MGIARRRAPTASSAAGAGESGATPGESAATSATLGASPSSEAAAESANGAQAAARTDGSGIKTQAALDQAAAGPDVLPYMTIPTPSDATASAAARVAGAGIPGIGAMYTGVSTASTSRFAPFRESYEDMNELRRALKVVSVQRNAPYYMQHSSPQRVEARCPTWRQRRLKKQQQQATGSGDDVTPVPACDFVVSANRHANGRVYVTRAVVTHSPACPVLRARLEANSSNSGITGTSMRTPGARGTSVSATALLETARPFMGALANALGGGDAVKPKDMANIMKEKFGVSASYMTAWRALSAYRQQGKLEEAASYMKLQGYLQDFVENNPGSTMAFEHGKSVTSTSGVTSKIFARAFLCPKAMQDALRYCRGSLLLSVFLGTSAFGGVVFTATAQDAMGDNVPLAIALAPSESEREWRFFLLQLQRALPDMERCVTSLVHNRGEDLTQAALAVLPDCTQSDNVDIFIRSPGQNNGSASGAATSGATSKTPSVELSMQWMEPLCAKAPLMILVGWVSQVARTLFQRYECYGHLSSEYPAEFHALVAQYEAQAPRFDVIRIAESGFEVIEKHSGRPRVVDFTKQTCSCGDYDTSGFPCLHVFLAVSSAGMLRTDVIPRIFLMTSLKALYSGRITPIDIDTIAPDGITVPQPQPKARGRPRKVQQIQQFGEAKQEKLSCSVCGVKGHNKRTCKRTATAHQGITAASASLGVAHSGGVSHTEDESEDSAESTDGQDANSFLSAYEDTLRFDNTTLGGSGAGGAAAGASGEHLTLDAEMAPPSKRRRMGESAEAAEEKKSDDSADGVALV